MKAADFERARHVIDGLKSVKLLRLQGVSTVRFTTKSGHNSGQQVVEISPDSTPELHRIFGTYLDAREAHLRRIAAQISLDVREI